MATTTHERPEKDSPKKGKKIGIKELKLAYKVARQVAYQATAEQIAGGDVERILAGLPIASELHQQADELAVRLREALKRGRG